MQWQIYRHSVMSDPFGSRRRLKPSSKKSRPRRAISRADKKQPTSKIQFEKLEFHLEIPHLGSELPRNAHASLRDSHGFINRVRRHPARLHWLACGDKLDVAWTPFSLHTMLVPGKLSKFSFPVKQSVVIDDVRWDGKRLWVATLASGIWVLDSRLDVIKHIHTREGLPPSEHAIRIQPLENGRACAVGSFGPNFRGWCAMISIRADQPRVHVFHEAKEVVPSQKSQLAGSGDRQENVQQAFVPFLLFRYSKPAITAGKTRTLLYVGRHTINASQPTGSLQINLADLTVSANPLAAELLSRIDTRHFRDDQFYNFQGKLFHVTDFRLLLKEVSSQSLPIVTGSQGDNPGQGFIRVGQQVHLPTAHGWYRLDLLSGSYENLVRDDRQYARFFRHQMPIFARSAHYGMIFWRADSSGFTFQKIRIKSPISEPSLGPPVQVAVDPAGAIRPETGSNTKSLPVDSIAVPSENDLEPIRKRIRELLRQGHTLSPEASILYTSGIATFDGWLPYVDIHAFLDPPLKKEGFQFFIQSGHVVRVTSLSRGSCKVNIWHSDSGAPLLAVRYDTRREAKLRLPVSYKWGIYDNRGLLEKIIHFDRNLRIQRLNLFEHADGYQSVTKNEYSRTGTPSRREVVIYPLDSQGVPILPGDNRPIAYSPRLEKIKEPTRVGLKPYYPPSFLVPEGRGPSVVP